MEKRPSKNKVLITDFENQFHPVPKGGLIFNNFPLGILG